MQGMMQDLAFAIPGVDEAMGFAEIMKCVTHIALPVTSCQPVVDLLWFVSCRAGTSSRWSSRSSSLTRPRRVTHSASFRFRVCSRRRWANLLPLAESLAR